MNVSVSLVGVMVLLPVFGENFLKVKQPTPVCAEKAKCKTVKPVYMFRSSDDDSLQNQIREYCYHNIVLIKRQVRLYKCFPF